MPVSKEAWQEFQKGFNRGKKMDDEEEKKKKRSASVDLKPQKRASKTLADKSPGIGSKKDREDFVRGFMGKGKAGGK